MLRNAASRPEHMLRAVLLALAVTAEADFVSLRDHPIATAAAPTYLDGDAWTASTVPPPIAADEQAQQQPPPKINITVPATVPGDLITDLQRAKIIADPWLDTTWIQNSSLWSDHAWTFSTTFAVAAPASVYCPGLCLCLCARARARGCVGVCGCVCV